MARPKTQTWVRRLADQLPGWHVWYTSGPPRGWYAVPAPRDVEHERALQLPGRIGPYSQPGRLRDDALCRYGWDDDCQTCGGPARECGHRQPESER